MVPENKNSSWWGKHGSKYQAWQLQWLHENGPHGLLCLDTWFLLGEPVLEELGGITLLKEVCHWGGL